jgi:cysteine desulfurase
LFYFDYNATTPPAPEVIETYAAALRDVPGNASSTHRAGQAARQRLEDSRVVIARALGCSANEVVFTSGGTEANNLAILGLVRNLAGQDKHVVTTPIEHPSVLGSIRQLEQEGVKVTLADAADLRRHIRPETVLVSVMHANNETGSIQAVEEVVRLIQELRASGQSVYLHTDGVQAFGKLDVNAAALGVDLYSVSAHKVHGPKGIGALYVRQGTPLRGIQLGGRHERDRRAGTENVPGAIAFACAAELLRRYSMAEVACLRDRFEEQVLSNLDEVEVNGCAAKRLPNTSNLLFHDVSGEALLIALDIAGFAVSTGSACTSGSIEPSHVLLAMGRSAVEARSSVRFSFGRDNGPDDTDRLSEIVIKTVRRLRNKKSLDRRQLVAG